MLKKIDLKSTLISAAIAAIAFSIPVYFYIRDTTYAQTWLVYLGSFLFFIVIVLQTMFFNKLRRNNANTTTMVFAAHVVTLIGVIFSCILAFLLLSLMVPGYLDAGPAAVASPDTPPNEIHDKTNGLSFRIFIGATIFNFAFGSFAGFMFPFTIKKDQVKESGEPYPLENKITEPSRK